MDGTAKCVYLGVLFFPQGRHVTQLNLILAVCITKITVW